MKIEEEIKQQQFVIPQHRAGMNIIFTANWLQNQIAVLLKPLDLSLQQLNVLAILKGQPDCTAPVHLIKERLIDRMPNVSRLINKLMDKGLLSKDRDRSDQRVVFVKLTPAGKELAIKGRKLFNKISVHIDDKEANLLNDLLTKLRG
jgi:DNA-binding MarR family transcriptional regulator